MNSKVYKVIGMHCPACATAIELDLEDVGVIASCSYAKQALEVDGNTDKEELKKVIKLLGYDLE